MYEFAIYGEKTSEKTGKVRKVNAATVKSKATEPVAAVDDLKSVLGKLKKEQLAQIVEIRIAPAAESSNGEINFKL